MQEHAQRASNVQRVNMLQNVEVLAVGRAQIVIAQLVIIHHFAVEQIQVHVGNVHAPLVTMPQIVVVQVQEHAARVSHVPLSNIRLIVEESAVEHVQLVPALLVTMRQIVGGPVLVRVWHVHVHLDNMHQTVVEQVLGHAKRAPVLLVTMLPTVVALLRGHAVHW